MKPAPLLAIVRGERIDTVSAKGGRSYVQVRGLLHYVAYGHYAEQLGQEPQQRGAWLDQAGRPHTHEAVQEWARAKVHRFEYDHAYQLLLSTRDGGLPAAAFNKTLQQGSDITQVREWRFMVHDDTDYQHAHAILFSHEKLAPARYKEWQQTMQAELGHLQAERQTTLAQQADLTRQVEPETEPSSERALEQTQNQDWDLAYD